MLPDGNRITLAPSLRRKAILPQGHTSGHGSISIPRPDARHSREEMIEALHRPGQVQHDLQLSALDLADIGDRWCRWRAIMNRASARTSYCP